MNRFKKIKYFGMFWIIMLVFSIGIFSAFAEDEEEDEDEDEEYSSSSTTARISQTTDVKTDVSTKTVTLKDSDGDGILDNSDPHPSVAEIYIVKDDNSNGIVDDFEVLNKDKNVTQ